MGTLGCWCPFLLHGLLVFIRPSLVTLPQDRAFLPSPPLSPAALFFSGWLPGQLGHGAVGSVQQGAAVACGPEWEAGWRGQWGLVNGSETLMP